MKAPKGKFAKTSTQRCRATILDSPGCNRESLADFTQADFEKRENDKDERAMKGGGKSQQSLLREDNWLLRKPDTKLTGQLLAKVTGHTAEVKAWGPTFQ